MCHFIQIDDDLSGKETIATILFSNTDDVNMAYENDSREKFEDTEGVIRSRKSKTNRQYNDQENKDKQ